ncbi:tryptophan halogenase family protein [Caulobacter sp. 17J80-11]|uniref:tryptophan halogenase family protein n=1 Tax=Caulobacter sp. 17J80-11 TaxID=2763502 RepID=UPI0016538E0B|nr:tryptophan halogenase family protein [Caulobacter sp. 17J80-11]MBC6983413.1 tryptophan 7-halogenase [Caulobacter sp. 17J80-11]
MNRALRDIVIVGGGTAGWMAAAALSKVVGTQNYSITLVESEQIGTVGVGEATIPAISLFNNVLGLDEDEFVRETNATFKLGIEFIDWARLGHTYHHPFGLFAGDLGGIGFSHYWFRWLKAGGDPDNLMFSAEAEAARRGRFTRADGRPGLPKLHYAFHFDASLYAAYLRRFAEARGVVRVEGKVVRVRQHAETGFIEGLELDDGRRLHGDFFFDCSGFRGLLIEETLKSGYEDWSRWLPMNRAAAMPCARVEDPAPLTRSTAREAGWQWRIPLQHRTGNGYVFCNEFIAEQEAMDLLSRRLDGAALDEPRLLKFVTGRRKTCWVKNCLALGLASGFLEPLESTSIHLVQSGISKFLTLFPKNGCDPKLVDRFNWEMERDYVSVRDFVIAHYKVSERDDTPFWRYCRDMDAPDTLAAKLELFRTRGEVLVDNHELFREVNWFAVLYGQGLVPQDHHPVADVMSDEELRIRLSGARKAILERVAAMPTHQEFIDRHCSALRSVDAA